MLHQYCDHPLISTLKLKQIPWLCLFLKSLVRLFSLVEVCLIGIDRSMTSMIRSTKDMWSVSGPGVTLRLVAKTIKGKFQSGINKQQHDFDFGCVGVDETTEVEACEEYFNPYAQHYEEEDERIVSELRYLDSPIVRISISGVFRLF